MGRSWPASSQRTSHIIGISFATLLGARDSKDLIKDLKESPADETLFLSAFFSGLVFAPSRLKTRYCSC